MGRNAAQGFKVDFCVAPVAHAKTIFDMAVFGAMKFSRLSFVGPNGTVRFVMQPARNAEFFYAVRDIRGLDTKRL